MVNSERQREYPDELELNILFVSERKKRQLPTIQELQLILCVVGMGLLLSYTSTLREIKDSLCGPKVHNLPIYLSIRRKLPSRCQPSQMINGYKPEMSTS